MVFDLLQTLLAAGLSQAEISRRTGIPAPSIHRLLNGKQVEVVYSHGKALERAVLELNNPTDGLPPEVASKPPAAKPVPVPTTPLAPTLGEPRLGSDRRDDERRKPDPRSTERREDERRQEGV
jgi:hypothetical protein